MPTIYHLHSTIHMHAAHSTVVLMPWRWCSQFPRHGNGRESLTGIRSYQPLLFATLSGLVIVTASLVVSQTHRLLVVHVFSWNLGNAHQSLDPTGPITVERSSSICARLHLEACYGSWFFVNATATLYRVFSNLRDGRYPIDHYHECCHSCCCCVIDKGAQTGYEGSFLG